MADREGTRRYSDEEEAAFRACGVNPMYGPAQFAGGHYWPDELDKRADRMERLLPQMRLAARALRREIATDPLTADGVADVPTCSTCEGTGVVDQQGIRGAPGSSSPITCPDCGPTPSQVVDADS